MIACDYRYRTASQKKKPYIMFTRLPTGRQRSTPKGQRKLHTFLTKIEYV